MKHIQDRSYRGSNACVAVGHFDGMHLGHQAVLQQLMQVARDKGQDAVLVSFESAPNTAARIITTEREKLHWAQQYPLAAMVSIPPADIDEPFINDVLVAQFGAATLVVGQNHPALAQIHKACSACGCNVVECDVVSDKQGPIDSKRVLNALQRCDIESVTQLLGHPYIVIGEVVKGKQLGRTVGQPTANIQFPQHKQLLPDGSYATVTTVDGVRHVGMTNIGRRPTVDNFDYTTIENHILDFSGDLYGKELILEFCRFIRGVDKFNSLAEMQAQVAKDVQAIRDYLDLLG